MSKFMVVLLKIHWQHVEHTLQGFQPMKQLTDILGKIPIIKAFLKLDMQHFRYDYNKRIFYFCDISPKTNEMQCYKYIVDTRKA